MQASQTPTLVPLAFAANGTKNAIPESSQIGITPGAASLNDGFPPLTFTPIAAGGVPPAGADFNGVLNLITQTIRWKHAGGQFKYNSTFANDSNVGGYPAGAMLLNTAGTGIWLNTVDGNTSNPDTGGAGWVAGFSSPLSVGPATQPQHALQLGQATGRYLGTQIITSSQTVNPGIYNGVTAKTWRVRGVAGGGGSAGASATGTTTISVGTGGQSGAYCEFYMTAASTSATVGAGGAPGTTGNGGTGGNSTFGSLAALPGGVGGGIAGAAAPPFTQVTGGASGSPTGTANFVVAISGQLGMPAIVVSTAAILSGSGGSNPFGTGGNASVGGVAQTGSGFGSGGGGAANPVSTSARNGTIGFPGYWLVDEFA
jgi:hypothetical protein